MAKFKDRRSSPKAGKVQDVPADRPKAAALRDSAGFHTMDVMKEFIQYDLDGGAQTEWNERFVMPLCLAVVSVDNLKKVSANAGKISEAIGKLTRRADRTARSGDDYVILLRRTLAKRANDSYVPNLRKAIKEACATGPEPQVTIGIASLTEHMITGAEDMVKKALAARDYARKQGTDQTSVYDFRIMPY